MKGPRPKPLAEKLLNLSVPEPNSGCWLWLGVLQGSGYGSVGIGSMRDGTRTMIGAHRAAYLAFCGVIPVGLFVLHKCDNKLCINPDHLFLGTQADNNADKLAKGRHHYAKRTHCKHGHEFNIVNTRYTAKGRMCRRCGK